MLRFLVAIHDERCAVIDPTRLPRGITASDSAISGSTKPTRPLAPHSAWSIISFV